MKKVLFIPLLIIFLLIPFLIAKAGLGDKLKGKILLQVESKGEAWYINPDNSQRYYLGRPNDAFSVMRSLGLGISNNDFDSFNGYAPQRLSGKILLKVEDSGKAYYVNPANRKMHYLGRPDDAFSVMRSLGLGISNNDIAEISISVQSSLPGSKKENNNQATETVKTVEKESEKKTESQNINEFITGVVAITCFDENGSVVSDGSGSLWNFGPDFGYAVLTNNHVITTDICYIHAEDITFQELDSKQYSWNGYADIAVHKIKKPDSGMNYKISELTKCNTTVNLATEIYVIGYPAFAVTKNNWNARTITEGIISAYDRRDDNLDYPNYYVSATIDSGNSGGIALAKEGDGFCTLGVPTWLSIGNYETQGVVQNIHNAFSK